MELFLLINSFDDVHEIVGVLVDVTRLGVSQGTQRYQRLPLWDIRTVTSATGFCFSLNDDWLMCTNWKFENNVAAPNLLLSTIVLQEYLSYLQLIEWAC